MGLNKHIVEIKKNDYIFVAIPKTGTNTIWDKILKVKNFYPFQHNKAITIKNQISTYEWDNRYSFACVRNPYDLIKSWYDFHKTHKNIGQDVKDFYPDTIEEWANKDFPTHWEWPSHKKHNPFWDGSNPLHQHKWVTDNDGNLIVDHVMKQETLAEDFSVVAEKYGFNNDLKHLNSSKNDSVLSDEVRDKIYKTFKKDFDLFYKI